MTESRGSLENQWRMSRYFIRYLADGSERPYRVYFLNEEGRIRRTRSRGHRSPDEAAKHVERLCQLDYERLQGMTS